MRAAVSLGERWKPAVAEATVRGMLDFQLLSSIVHTHVQC
jgi:hypothetical protein